MAFFLTGGLVVAVGAAILSYRSSERSGWWLLGGAVLLVAGVVAAFNAFGWMWMASMEGRSETPGAVLFIVGVAGIFVGIGMLVGRAVRWVAIERTALSVAAHRPRRTRVLATTALGCFLAGQACLLLYLMGYLAGTAAAYASAFTTLTMVASWMLVFLAVRSSGRPPASTAFLLAAPLPVLVADAMTFVLNGTENAYVVLAAMVVVVAGLALAWTSPKGRTPPVGRPAAPTSRKT